MEIVAIVLGLGFFATLVAIIALVTVGDGSNSEVAKEAIEVLGKAIAALDKLLRK